MDVQIEDQVQEVEVMTGPGPGGESNIFDIETTVNVNLSSTTHPEPNVLLAESSVEDKITFEFLPEAYNSPAIGPPSVNTRIILGAINAPVRITASDDDERGENLRNSLIEDGVFTTAFTNINEAKSPSTVTITVPLSVHDIMPQVHDISIIEQVTFNEIINDNDGKLFDPTSAMDSNYTVTEANNNENSNDDSSAPTIIVAASTLLSSSVNKNDLLPTDNASTTRHGDADNTTTVQDPNSSIVLSSAEIIQLSDNPAVYTANSARNPFKQPRILSSTISFPVNESYLPTDPRPNTRIYDNDIADGNKLATNLATFFEATTSKMDTNKEEKLMLDQTIEMNEEHNNESSSFTSTSFVKKSVTLGAFKPPRKLSESAITTIVTVSKRKTQAISTDGTEEYVNELDGTVGDNDPTVSFSLLPTVIESTENKNITINSDVISIAKKRKPIVLKRTDTTKPTTVSYTTSTTTTGTKRSKVTPVSQKPKLLTIDSDNDSNDSLLDTDDDDENTPSTATGTKTNITNGKSKTVSVVDNNGYSDI